MTKALIPIAAVLLLLALTGCQTGYWRVNEAPRQNTNWAAITNVVGQQLGRTHP